MKESKLQKNRILEGIIFGIILIILIVIFDALSCKAPFAGYINKVTVTSGIRYGSDEVCPKIIEVKQTNDSKNLVMGDSVANQLFERFIGENSEYQVSPVNRAMTFAGQYILVAEYLDNHPEATDIYIIICPTSLAATVDSDLAYQYVVMPFFEEGLTEYLDDLVMTKLEKRYGSFFLKPNVARIIDYSGINRKLFFNYLSNKEYDEVEDVVVSDITVDYLEKIYSLCSEKGVKIHLMSTPVPDIEEKHKQQDEIREVFAANGLDKMYPNYCDSFIYYPVELFLDDKIHFKPEYKNAEMMNPMIEEMIMMDDSVSGLGNIFDKEEVE